MKRGLAEIPAPQALRANCSSPLAEMSRAEEILEVDTPHGYCCHSNCLPVTAYQQITAEKSKEVNDGEPAQDSSRSPEF